MKMQAGVQSAKMGGENANKRGCKRENENEKNANEGENANGGKCNANES